MGSQRVGHDWVTSTFTFFFFQLLLKTRWISFDRSELTTFNRILYIYLSLSETGKKITLKPDSKYCKQFYHKNVNTNGYWEKETLWFQ